MHFKLFKEHVFVVNSAKVAKELFEKRSNIYSDRCALKLGLIELEVLTEESPAER